MQENKVIFSMDRVGKIYPGNKQVLRDISLGYYYGAKIGVIGLNGSGKSSLLKIMAGIDTDYVGRIGMSKGYTIGYLEQEPQLDPEKTVLQCVQEAVQDKIDIMNRYNEISMLMCEPMDDNEMDKLLNEQGNLQDILDSQNIWDLDSRLEMAMDALRCPPAEMKVELISGGEKRRVALCKLLLQEPDILLLDEPTNHLDAETVLWLEKHLKDYKGTVIAITHDRYFLDNVSEWILELDRGYGIPWKGNYSSWLEQKQKSLMDEEKKEHKRIQTLARELEWIRATPKANHEKNKARISNFEKLAAEANEKRNETNELFIPSSNKLGKKVIHVDNLRKAFDDKLLIEDLSFDIPAGAIVGIIGPNGAGKTTLFKMLMGQEKQDDGSIEIGDTVNFSYVDQNRDLEANKTMIELVGKGSDILNMGGREIPLRQYISWFNFPSTDHHRNVSELSGGERNRVYLALTLQAGGNVILLDEPTNDLDVNTIRALEEAIQSFAGSVLVISHDRYFLDRICTHILAFEGDSQVKFFDGNFSEYEEDKIRRLGDKALIPKRVSYRKLTRV
ncbi:MAG: energy-dependent translational throttle protein EttA [Candidatus Cloacimonadales bacterium]|jgi:ATP-binding cassette ChvD family protein|nr:energy-dependent translational throttle protein EttA [Candidatus Cloacimonadota bacterium]MDD2650315.1 energy-dependent translational throttle protein EttA [Candidatus Cloacimonadota bacterium]MDD3500886.1 energy-dependent translational throttle protein EttA [Candidatus Cloacimonadota bacterium]MDX9977088.1 energy-dependent translational throttle protein EttA [Candidatus Cloacimonadales bacterium]